MPSAVEVNDRLRAGWFRPQSHHEIVNSPGLKGGWCAMKFPKIKNGFVLNSTPESRLAIRHCLHRDLGINTFLIAEQHRSLYAHNDR